MLLGDNLEIRAEQLRTDGAGQKAEDRGQNRTVGSKVVVSVSAQKCLFVDGWD